MSGKEIMNIGGLGFELGEDVCSRYMKGPEDPERWDRIVSKLFSLYRLDSILLKMHNEALTEKYRKYPFVLIEATKYAVLNSTMYSELSTISDEEFTEILRVVAEIATCDVEFFRKLGDNPKEALASFILRSIGNQSRWDIYINNMMNFFRTVFMFDKLIYETDVPIFLKEIIDYRFKEKFGLPLVDFMTLGFILFAGSNKVGGMSRLYFDSYREKGIEVPSDDALKIYLKQVICDPDEFKNNADFRNFGLNPLLNYPLIRLWKDSGQEDAFDDKFIAPIPGLIVYRFTTGIYYQLWTAFKNKFSTAFGELFELYVGVILGWYKLPGKMLSEKEIKLHYHGKKPDWIIFSEKGIILIECKATYYTQSMYKNGIEASYKGCVDQIRKAIGQLDDFETHIPEVCESIGIKYENQPIQKLIVTFEPLLGLKWGPLRDFFNEGVDKDWKILWVWELEIIQPYIAKGADFWSFLIEYNMVTFQDIGKIVEKMRLQTGAEHSENPLCKYGERIFGRLLDEGKRKAWLSS